MNLPSLMLLIQAEMVTFIMFTMELHCSVFELIDGCKGWAIRAPVRELPNYPDSLVPRLLVVMLTYQDAQRAIEVIFIKKYLIFGH